MNTLTRDNLIQYSVLPEYIVDELTSSMSSRSSNHIGSSSKSLNYSVEKMSTFNISDINMVQPLLSEQELQSEYAALVASGALDM